MINNYVRSENKKYIINLIGDRLSFRCKQRSNDHSFKFVSFKTVNKEIKKNKILVGPYNFFSISKL